MSAAASRGKRRTYRCPATHAHGEKTTCYFSHRCGCAHCNEAASEYQRERRAVLRNVREHRAGNIRVPAEPIREHLTVLLDYGIGWTTLADQAQCSVTHLRNIVHGYASADRQGRRPEMVHLSIARRILALQPRLEDAGAGDAIDATGTRRRLQALIARGWSANELAKRLGITRGNMGTLLHHKPRLFASRARQVAELYDALWDQQPPRETPQQKTAYKRALTQARTHGWVPPLAWDDIDHDPAPPVVGDDAEDTLEQLDEIAIELAIAGKRPALTPAERQEVMQRMQAKLLPHSRIAAAIGVQHSSVSTLLRRMSPPSMTG